MGGTYTLAEPLYFSGNQINIRTASSSQTGVLTSAKFNDFEAKFGEGSTVNTFFNFNSGSALYFEKINSGTQGLGKIQTGYLSNIDNKDFIISSYLCNLYLSSTGTIIARSGQPNNNPGMGVEIDFGQDVNNSILKFNGTNFNFKTNTTPTNGQKFVVQYNSSTNTFFFVPM